MRVQKLDENQAARRKFLVNSSLGKQRDSSTTAKRKDSEEMDTPTLLALLPSLEF